MYLTAQPPPFVPCTLRQCVRIGTDSTERERMADEPVSNRKRTKKNYGHTDGLTPSDAIVGLHRRHDGRLCHRPDWKPTAATQTAFYACANKKVHTKQLAKKKEPKKKYWSYRWANALDWMPPPRRRTTAGGHGRLHRRHDGQLCHRPD